LQCANNLHEIACGLNNYADTHPAGESPGGARPQYPAGTIANAAFPPERRLSWFVEVLPYIEQDNLYQRIDRRAAWDDPANAAAVQTPLRVMQCPDWGREAAPSPPYLTAYLGVAGVGPGAADLAAGDPKAGVFGHDRRTPLAAIADGTSNTMLILESARDNGPWAQGGPATVRGLDPAERPCLGSGRPFGGTHFAENTLWGRGKSIGCNAALADGSVRFLTEKTAPEALEALATVAGGEEIKDGW
jgi:hypothetical protein